MASTLSSRLFSSSTLITLRVYRRCETVYNVHSTTQKQTWSVLINDKHLIPSTTLNEKTIRTLEIPWLKQIHSNVYIYINMNLMQLECFYSFLYLFSSILKTLLLLLINDHYYYSECYFLLFSPSSTPAASSDLPRWEMTPLHFFPSHLKVKDSKWFF